MVGSDRLNNYWIVGEPLLLGYEMVDLKVTTLSKLSVLSAQMTMEERGERRVVSEKVVII